MKRIINTQSNGKGMWLGGSWLPSEMFSCCQVPLRHANNNAYAGETAGRELHLKNYNLRNERLPYSHLLIQGNLFRIICFTIAMFYLSSFAAYDIVTLNPGIKVGYEFGEKAGFILSVDCGISRLYLYILSAGANTGLQYAFGTNTWSPYIDVTLGLFFVNISLGGQLDVYDYGSEFKPYYKYSLGYFEYISYKQSFSSFWKEFSLNLAYPFVIETLDSNTNIVKMSPIKWM